jgi:hypothetical protein
MMTISSIKPENVAQRSYSSGDSVNVLHAIHLESVNIAIWRRKELNFSEEIGRLMSDNIQLRLTGSVEELSFELEHQLALEHSPLIKNDVLKLLHEFHSVAKVSSYRLLFARVDNDMCRRFHTDVIDLRCLCTYEGPGTMWVPDHLVDRLSLHSGAPNEKVISDLSQVQQCATGDVLILKGELYPKDNTKAVVHKSPGIESKGISRLILRIDTNEIYFS